MEIKHEKSDMLTQTLNTDHLSEAKLIRTENRSCQSPFCKLVRYADKQYTRGKNNLLYPI